MYMSQDLMWREILKSFWFLEWTKQGRIALSNTRNIRVLRYHLPGQILTAPIQTWLDFDILVAKRLTYKKEYFRMSG